MVWNTTDGFHVSQQSPTSQYVGVNNSAMLIFGVEKLCLNFSIVTFLMTKIS